MKKYFLATLILFFGAISYASGHSINVEGYYDCNWVNNSTGDNVKGVMILKKSGQTYSMKSKYDDNSSYSGTGIYNQTKHNFALVFYNPKNSEETGVAIADINRRAISPIWTWAYVNKKTIEHTTCIKRTA